MSKENEKTLEVYKEKAKNYLASSIEHDRLDPVRAMEKRENLENLIKMSFLDLPKQSKVFEIGSADGTNAQFIKELGFKVIASDIAEDFIEATKSKGLDIIKFNAINDEFPEKYAAIFCWRVFVHFTKEDALKIIQKAYNALENNGIFIFNAINRENKSIDNEWIDFEGEYHMGAKRYYNYFLQDELDDIIKHTKFQIKNFHKEGGSSKSKWLVYVLEKSV